MISRELSQIAVEHSINLVIKPKNELVSLEFRNLRKNRRAQLSMHEQLVITNPKRRPVPFGRDRWFPYYAGFSYEFARQIVKSSGLEAGSVFLDPWNGSGTTTLAASLHGYRAFGVDLNPVMAVAAKARLFPRTELPSVEPLLADIVKKARLRKRTSLDDDPLLMWFMPTSAVRIRAIDRAVYTLLVSVDSADATVHAAARLSPLAAFFNVALFRTIRSLLSRFTRSNPTWVRRPADSRERISPSFEEMISLFYQHVRAMAASIGCEPGDWDLTNVGCTIAVGSSEDLPISSNSVDFVLSSPPYCTRIDYGIATSPELAVLGFCIDKKLHGLRSQLIGTPTIQETIPDTNVMWGPTCNAFLGQLFNHPSKAAPSYYYKTYAQYFAGIWRSLNEVSRCTKAGAPSIIVVQDSHFKDLRADLASIFIEMGYRCRLSLSRRMDFPMVRNFVNINTRSRNYREDNSACESVLCFIKN